MAPVTCKTKGRGCEMGRVVEGAHITGFPLLQLSHHLAPVSITLQDEVSCLTPMKITGIQ